MEPKPIKRLQRQNGTGGKANHPKIEAVKRVPTVPVRVARAATRDALAPYAEAEGVSVGEILDRAACDYISRNKQLSTTSDPQSDLPQRMDCTGHTQSYPTVTFAEVVAFVKAHYPKSVLNRLTPFAQCGRLDSVTVPAGGIKWGSGNQSFAGRCMNANQRVAAQSATLEAARLLFGHRGFCGRGEVAMLDDLSRTFDAVDLTDVIGEAWRINKNARYL